MPMISQGVLEPARVIAQRNVALLAEAVRQGYKVIATEPSAVLALTHEYPMILDDDEDAVTVAQNTFDACHYLWQLHQSGKLKLDFQPQRISVGYHVPCHLRALGVGAPAENLLRLVPGIRVTPRRKGLQRHRRTVWHQAGELPGQPAGRLRIDRRRPHGLVSDWHDRVQHV